MKQDLSKASTLPRPKPRRSKNFWIGFRAGYAAAIHHMHDRLHALEVEKIDKWRQHDVEERIKNLK